MSRRATYRSEVSRGTEQFVWIVLLLVVFGVPWATGWGGDIIGWAGDLILEQIEKIGNTQPE